MKNTLIYGSLVFIIIVSLLAFPQISALAKSQSATTTRISSIWKFDRHVFTRLAYNYKKPATTTPTSPTPPPPTATSTPPAATSTPPTGAFTPPGNIVKIQACNGDASHDTEVITSALAAAGAGNTAEFAAGTSYRCVVRSFTVPNGVYLYAEPAAAVTLAAATPGAQINTGNVITIGSNATINGSYAVQSCNIIFEMAGQTNPTIGNVNIGSAACGYDRIQANGTTGALIKNNNFNHTGKDSPPGYGTIGAYGPTRITIDGNRFDTHIGHNDFIVMADGAGDTSAITRNVFQHAGAAVMEIGFQEDVAKKYTTNMTVSNNWANLFDCGATNGCMRSGQGIGLAYSLVFNGTGSTGNIVSNNYADGATQLHNGTTQSDIGIEIQGSAMVSNNLITNFNFGVIGAYTCPPSPGVQIANNTFNKTVYGLVVNYGNCPNFSTTPAVQNSAAFATPPQPTRAPWGGKN